MVGFDYGAFSKPAFDHIRIDRSLHQKVHRTDLLCFLLKDTDKFFSNDLSLCFRLRHPRKLLIKPLLGIDTDKIKIIRPILAKYRFHLITFMFAKQPMIHENTGKLLSHRLCQKHRRYGRIHPAGKCAKHFACSYLFANL